MSFSFCAPDVDQLVEAVFQASRHTRAVVGARFADAFDYAAAYVFLGALLGLVGAQGGKSGLYLPEYARNLEKLFTDGRAGAIDGDP